MFYRLFFGSEKSRGTFASGITTILTVILSLFVKKTISIDELAEFIFVQTIFGDFIGLVMDLAIGTTKGFNLFKSGNKSGLIDYVLKQLGSRKHLKYWITIAIDLFTTIPLYILFIRFLDDYKIMMEQKDIRNTLVGMALFSVTFYMYSNMTRFEWAYCTPSASKDKCIPDSMIIFFGVSLMISFMMLPSTIEGGFFTTKMGKFILVGISAFLIVFYQLTRGLIMPFNKKTIGILSIIGILGVSVGGVVWSKKDTIIKEIKEKII